MKYDKIDDSIVRFFAKLARYMQSIGISTNMAVNFFIILQIVTQIAHPIVLYYEGKSMQTIQLLSALTLIWVVYLIWVAKVSRMRPVWIDGTRVLSSILAIITTFHFVHVRIVDAIVIEQSFTENLLGDTMHLLTSLSFMLVMHFASVPDLRTVEKNKRLHTRNT